ncbi:hypothetical protein EC991_007424 [Linnemannia zychae]|nr:hypothetical protein EC991_007424 [Linnemannia zychae]
MDNLFNTDSGFRPPSPLTFSSAPGPSLFGDSLGFEDFRFANQDFLNMSTAATATTSSSSGQSGGGGAAPPLLPGMMMSDPSMQLFNPSEQRYFSEFLDTLVVDQDFTFDPSAIPNLPNLPNLPLFTQDVAMPGGFNVDINNPYRTPGVLPPPQQQQTPQLPSQQPSIDYDMNSSSFNDQQAPLYTQQQQQHAISVPAKRTKTNKGAASTSTSSASIDNPTRRGTPSSRPSSLDAHAASTAQDPSGNRIATPIQQLSKLSLNQSAAQAAAAAAASVTTSSTKAKKNKREDDDPAQPGSSNGNLNQRLSSRSQPYNMQHQHHHQRQHKEGSRDRNTSMSDEDGGGSDSLTSTKGASTSVSAGAGAPPSTVTPKRKPYKELLTEEEKRANHIASEQKRRNTIRNGFKDMTDIIPDLKDVNSSKSTILFKAVDFIKHLERRNRLLQEKATQLESRLLMQKGSTDSNGHQQIQSQAQAHQQQQHQAQQHSSSNSSYRTSPYDTQHHPSQQQSQHGAAHLPQYHNQHHSHHTHHHQQQHRGQQSLYHNPGLDDKRLQEIPNIYPVSMSR